VRRQLRRGVRRELRRRVYDRLRRRLRRAPEPAPRRLRAEARAVDTGLLAIAVGARIGLAIRRDRDRESRAGHSLAGRRDGPASRIGAISAPLLRVAGQQLGSPGQRLLGLRTLDARTGRRVALGPSLALAAMEIATTQLTRRVMLGARSSSPARVAAAVGVGLALSRLRTLAARRLISPVVVRAR